ncbi:hypothetical protein P154DRAFT_583308 [Amniculicola lignicola CBS 123094]|uniref:Uncharacterized protein n=1 Tax=Amniculicola lignicola CBS 123094 TaxID=1392246 RepID=A0A6A5VT01_9PLEO|nr:hypothetical protein P154DRAFT_583308 [Amniculicola lignicola CBS 123094]
MSGPDALSNIIRTLDIKEPAPFELCSDNCCRVDLCTPLSPPPPTQLLTQFSELNQRYCNVVSTCQQFWDRFPCYQDEESSMLGDIAKESSATFVSDLEKIFAHTAKRLQEVQQAFDRRARDLQMEALTRREEWWTGVNIFDPRIHELFVTRLQSELPANLGNFREYLCDRISDTIKAIARFNDRSKEETRTAKRVFLTRLSIILTHLAEIGHGVLALELWHFVKKKSLNDPNFQWACSQWHQPHPGPTEALLPDILKYAQQSRTYIDAVAVWRERMSAYNIRKQSPWSDGAGRNMLPPVDQGRDLKYLSEYAYSEISIKLLLTLGKNLPTELLDIIFEFALEAESMPLSGFRT